jgi:hypothetical protein
VILMTSWKSTSAGMRRRILHCCDALSSPEEYLRFRVGVHWGSLWQCITASTAKRTGKARCTCIDVIINHLSGQKFAGSDNQLFRGAEKSDGLRCLC